MKIHEEHDAWLALAARAEEQYGLVTTGQLLVWFSRRQLTLRAQRGLLVSVARGVWRLSGSSPSWRQRVNAACLSIGPPVLASHATAGRLWDFNGIAATDAIEVTVPGRRRPETAIERVAIHRHHLLSDDAAEHYRIPVTTPARTLADLAACIPPAALARAIDHALRKGLTTVPELRRQLRLRPRLRGAGVLDALVAQREEHGTGDSEWEDTVLHWIIKAGLPIPRRHLELALARRVVVLDLAYPEEKVGVEFDGFEWHNGRTKFDDDRARLGELAVAGWAVIPVTSACREEDAVDRVRRALVSRGRRPAGLTERARPA